MTIEAVCERYGMQPSLAKFSARAIKASWWLGTASLAFGLFIKITSELLDHEVSGVDRTILLGFAKGRTPCSRWWPWIRRHWDRSHSWCSFQPKRCAASLERPMGALQLVAASVGAGILTTTIKDYIDRARPGVVTQLVEVSSLSCPGLAFEMIGRHSEQL